MAKRNQPEVTENVEVVEGENVDQIEGRETVASAIEGADGSNKAKRPRSNEYLLEEWSEDDLPKRQGGGFRGPRDSVLDKQVMAVIEKFPEGTGQLDSGKDRLVMIAKYGNGGQGGVSAATTLRKRWSERNKGLTFLSRALDDETRGVFVKYVPTEGDSDVNESATEG